MLAITFFITRRSKMENSYNDADVAGEIQQKYLRHEDHNIYYEIIGDSDKTLFFIHGWGGSTSSWKYQLDSFKDYKAIPCLAIHSPVYQLTEEYKNDFMTMYPKAEYYEIDNVSHFLMMEMPYRINQMMLDYLEKMY
jgi:pimeloyl-ACP methyl ester carboxylesterase